MFYISSQGHSATGWLANSLSMHPQIVCWHGTRSIPPYQSGKNDIKGKDFVKGLVQCEKSCFGHKVFGACHGYYGVQLKSYVEENNGIFLWIVRNPIKRVNSIFSAFAGPVLTYGLFPTDTKIDVHDLVKTHEKLIDAEFTSISIKEKQKFARKEYIRNSLDRLHILNLLKRLNITPYYGKVTNAIERRTVAKKKAILDKEYNNPIEVINSLTKHELVENIIQNFIIACQRTFKSDSELFYACNMDGLIKMEEMVRSQEYFNDVIFNKIMAINTDERYLNKVFNQQDHINMHSDVIKGPTEIFISWPKSFQNYFIENWDKHNLKSLYSKLGYQKP